MPRRGAVTAAVARSLRRRSTSWEQSLWRLLRNKRTGFHFRRQHRLAGYVLDFYCEAAKLCVEVDGSGHSEFRSNRDWIRDAELEKLGILTLRLTNEQVGADLHGCFLLIRSLCEERVREFRPDREEEDQQGVPPSGTQFRAPSPCPLPHAGRGIPSDLFTLGTTPRSADSR